MMAEKTAEVVGERIGDAYADATPEEARERSRKIVWQAHAGDRHAAEAVSHPFDRRPFVTAMATFVLGYVAALLVHRRDR